MWRKIFYVLTFCAGLIFADKYGYGDEGETVIVGNNGELYTYGPFDPEGETVIVGNNGQLYTYGHDEYGYSPYLDTNKCRMSSKLLML